ncbi:MAG: hypothetical protein VB049_02095 [Candidatus Pelethousia sp.]|nr:hypothetical protein [Candidatus Pelethousia sp.]
MCKHGRYVFMLLMAGTLLILSLLLYLGWAKQEDKPSNGTKFVETEEEGNV